MKKILIRKLLASDLDLILEWRNSDAVRENMYSNHIITPIEHQNWFERCSKDKTIINLIFEKELSPVGFISFSKINAKQGIADWAFYSGKNQIRGIGTIMELCALRYAFEKLKLRKLCCEVLSFNESVINFHKKFGFKEEGVRRLHYIRKGIAYDIHQLAIFKSTWKQEIEAMETKFLRDTKVIM
jgi:UDP-4-amino-4,6-dideoxy-N-acetyl-beta-L-altrosamine N-acetyltransferase